MQYSKPELPNENFEEKLLNSLLDKSGRLDFDSANSLLYSVRMLWMQRVDKLYTPDIEYFLWIHERFAPDDLKLNYPISIKSGADLIKFRISHKELEGIIYRNIIAFIDSKKGKKLFPLFRKLLKK